MKRGFLAFTAAAVVLGSWGHVIYGVVCYTCDVECWSLDACSCFGCIYDENPGVTPGTTGATPCGSILCTGNAPFFTCPYTQTVVPNGDSVTTVVNCEGASGWTSFTDVGDDHLCATATACYSSCSSD